jgi:Caspase domain
VLRALDVKRLFETSLPVVALLGALAMAQAQAPIPEPRTALVIGNGAYSYGALTNSVNHADAVAKALQDAGFDVTQTDADQAEMQGAIHALDGKLKAKGGADGSATHLSWQVGSSSYEGNGKLAGNLLTVDWGSSTTVVYALAAGGSLTGLWGAGEETLTPEE